jgi:hypothetical protein
VRQHLFHRPIRARTPAAQQELSRFEARYEARLKDLDLLPLTILVWGPGLKSDDLVAHKREQVRQELLDRGHVALFTEDIAGLPAEPGKNPSLRTREFAQAQSSHMVVILVEDSDGAKAEAEDFCNHPDIAPKAFVLAPHKYMGTYAAQGTFRLLGEGYGGVYWYKPEEMRSCNVLTQVLVRAQARREIYAMHREDRGTHP